METRKILFNKIKQAYIDYKSVLIEAGTGCHEIGYPILLEDGSIRPVEEIQIGNKLMGPDNLPREVLQLKRGREQMYKIKPLKGSSFTVNENHILHLIRTPLKEISKIKNNPKVVNVTIKEYLTWNKTKKHYYKIIHSEPINLPTKSLLVEPRFLGLWLGDGTTALGIVQLHFPDKEVLTFCTNYANSLNLKANIVSYKSKCPSVSIVGTHKIKGISQNQLLIKMRALGLSANKHIPEDYFKSSLVQRHLLLAGLLDSDGYLHNNVFEITQKSKQLSLDIVRLAKSLGYKVTLAEKIAVLKRENKEDYNCLVYRIHIGGDVHNIPTIIKRKQAKQNKPNKNSLVTGFKVEKTIVDNFYGFTLDKDHLYVDGNFIIQHNSGKTKMAIDLIQEKQRWLIVVPKIVLIDNWKDEFKKWNKEDLLTNVEFSTYAGLEKYVKTGNKRNVILDEAHAVNERRLMAIKDITNRYTLEGGKGRVIALTATVDEERRVLLRHLGIHPANTIKFSLDDAVKADIVADYKILVVNVPMLEISKWRQLDKWKGMQGTEADGYQALTSTYNSIKERGGDTKFATLNRLHYIYNLESKKLAAKLVLSQLNKERKLLTFGANIKQIEELCEYTYHSKKSKKDTTFTDFCNGDIMQMGAVQTIAEGVNIPDLDTGLIIQAMSKSRHAIQRLGRAGRKEKDKEALMIILKSEETQDAIWVRNSLKEFDQSKVFYTDINTVENEGIESIISNLDVPIQI